ncbi:hypothetical protein ACNTMW_02130 [Planosporangium sp. 12N6]|uniref:hypothetical protein n=1 Tax=Planosporangium spinosum TaxID=3402278 RepID=UPI003CF608E3
MPPRILTRQALPAVATLVAVLLTATACGGPAPGRADAGRATGVGADLRYGPAPTPNPAVTYQPDVVIVGGGGASVRSVTDDGLIWRLDPRAGRADQLAVGKIMFVTGRGVGRVLDVRRDGGDLAVTIGPVDITEVIKDGTFAADRPIALDDMTAYHAGEPRWADTEGPPPDAQGQVVPGALSTDGQIVLPRLRLGPTTGQADQHADQPADQPAARLAQWPLRAGGQEAAKAGGFNLTAICCSGGVGAHFTYDSNGVRLVGTVTLVMNKPSAKFHLGIRGGSVTQAELQVSGGAGLKVDVEGATRVGGDYNVNKRLAIPIDFSVPIGQVLGVPFSVTVNQWLIVKTAFSAKDGHLKAAGEYSFTGALGFGYADGSFGARVPQGFQVRNSLTNSIDGVSIGVNGMIVAYQARFYVGIGAFGFTAGLYFGLTASVGVTRGSSAGLIVCRGASLDILANYGVGYTIPAPVADVINFFLKTFKTAPVKNSGGIGATTKVLHRQEVVPDVPLCKA